jgi:HD-like signal output (HDOD) protein
MTDNNHSYASPQARVQDVLLLPPLPAIACRLLKLVAREDCRIEELAALIEQDPGLTARIIGIANSAYFARRTEICSVADAIVRVLGLNLVRGIAIGIALSKPFDAGACAGFQIDRYWYRAMQTANLAASLGRMGRFEPSARDCLPLCGLLHNLGQLALVHVFPDRMARVFDNWARQPDLGLLALESRHLAMTEIDAGAILARRWQLPPTVTDVIAFRREPRRAGTTAPVVQLIGYCAEVASAWYQDPGAASAPMTEAGAAFADTDAGRFDQALEQIRAQDPETRAMALSLARSA